MQKVIIIGTGIVGATTAYLLAKQQINVTMIDAEYDGRATSAGAGIVAPWANQRRNKAWYELARGGAAYYPQLIESLGDDNFFQTGYRRIGSLQLYDSPKRLEKMYGIVCEKRVLAPEIGRVEMLDERATAAAFPFVRDGFQSLYVEGAARVDGAMLRDTLIDAALLHGASYEVGVATLNDAHTVAINGRTLTADHIVLTNGVWMKDMLGSLGIRVNFYMQKGQLIHVQMPGAYQELPLVNIPSDPYIVPFDHGRIVIGATREDHVPMNPHHTLAGVMELLEKTFAFAPGLAAARLLEVRTGFRPFTPSFIPSFGRVPGMDSLLFANGLGSSGLTTGPYIGRILSELILEQSPSVDLAPYDMTSYLL